MKVFKKMFSKRTFTKALCGILTVALIAGFAPFFASNTLKTSAAEPIRFAENKVDESIAKCGEFYFATTDAALQENEVAPYQVRILRGGDSLPAAQLKLEMIDISAKYGDDYTVEILGSNAKVENAEGGSSVMEQMQSGDVEQMMYDDYGNDLSLTDDAAKAEYERNSIELNDAASNAWSTYLDSRAAQDGIDLSALDSNQDEMETTVPQSDISLEFEKQTGLVDDRVPMQSSAEQTNLGEVLEAGYGAEAYNGLMNELDAPSITFDFAEGETEKIIVIKTKDNDKGEGNKQSNCKLFCLSNSMAVSESYSALNITIEDDEKWEKPTVSFAQDTFKPEGGYAKVTVKREGISTGIVSVHMTAASGTAVAGRDFSEVDTEVAFPVGVNERLIKIPIVSTYLKDGGQFTLQLSNPANCQTGKAAAKVVIPKGAESYDPEKAGESVGEEGGISTVDATIDSEILADPIDLSKTVYTNSNGSGYTRMDGDDYVLRPKAGSWTSAKTGHAHAEWSITNRFGITGYKVNWEKTSGKPCYTYMDYSYCEKDPGDSGYEWKTELDTKDERWSSTNINIYSSKAAMSRIAVIDYKYRGNYSCTPKLTIHSMTPILRPFEVQLMNADASALKFVDEEGNFVQHDQLAETSHAGETSVVGGTIKWAKEGMDTISVKTNDSRYSWIKYLEIVRVDDKDPKKILSTNRCAGPFPTGTQVASVQLTESRLNWLGNNDYLDFSKNVTEKGS